MTQGTQNFIISNKSIKFHSDMNIVNLANHLMIHTNFTMMQYHVDSFLELSLLYREWYDLKELRVNKNKKDVLNVLNDAVVLKDKEVNSQNADMSILRFQMTKLGAIFLILIV